MTLPGGGELWIILLIVIVLFGAKKLPELANAMGKSIKEFRKGQAEASEEDDAASEDVSSEES